MEKKTLTNLVNYLTIPSVEKDNLDDKVKTANVLKEVMRRSDDKIVRDYLDCALEEYQIRLLEYYIEQREQTNKVMYQ